MNQKKFANIVLIVLVVILAGTVGYFAFVKKPTPSRDDSGGRDLIADAAAAEVTVLSQAGNILKIRIDKIREYSRHPAASNPQLQANDTISVSFGGWKDNFLGDDDKVTCSAGYNKTPKPVQPTPASYPEITVSEKYLSHLFGCFVEECRSIGWSVEFYNPTTTVIEYECIKERERGTPLPPTLLP